MCLYPTVFWFKQQWVLGIPFTNAAIIINKIIYNQCNGSNTPAILSHPQLQITAKTKTTENFSSCPLSLTEMTHLYPCFISKEQVFPVDQRLGSCFGSIARLLFTAFYRNLIKGGILSGVTRKSEEWEPECEPEGTVAFIKSAIDASAP